MNIAAHAWDNIDNFYKHRGISAYKMQIQELDKDGNPTGNYELLEDENGVKDQKIEHSVFYPYPFILIRCIMSAMLGYGRGRLMWFVLRYQRTNEFG